MIPCDEHFLSIQRNLSQAHDRAIWKRTRCARSARRAENPISLWHRHNKSFIGTRQGRRGAGHARATVGFLRSFR